MSDDGQKYYLFYFIPNIYINFIIIILYFVKKTEVSQKIFFLKTKQGFILFIVKNKCPYFIQPPPLKKINYCI